MQHGTPLSDELEEEEEVKSQGQSVYEKLDQKPQVNPAKKLGFSMGYLKNLEDKTYGLFGIKKFTL